MKKYNEYKKQQKRYIKNISKYIKENDTPDETYPIFIVLLMMLKRRLEFYESEHSIFSYSESIQIAIKTLKKAIELGEYATDYNNFTFADFEQYVEDIFSSKNPSTYYRGHSSEEWEKLAEKRISSYKEWLCYIVDNMQYWWD